MKNTHQVTARLMGIRPTCGYCSYYIDNYVKGNHGVFCKRRKLKVLDGPLVHFYSKPCSRFIFRLPGRNSGR